MTRPRGGDSPLPPHERARVELDATRAMLEAILDHAPTQIYVKDLDGRYVLANHQVEVESGIPHEAMIGHTDRELFPGSAFETWNANESEVLARRAPVECEEVFGDQTYLSLKFPLLDADGVVYAVGGISTNITARKSLEAAVESARREAEHANQAKSEFLSRVSHELRTPLNSVMGFAQLLRMDIEEEPLRESVDQILRAGRHLLELINDVLDISRIEAGELRLSLESVRVADVVAEVAGLIRVQAEQRGLRFEVGIGSDRVVRADRHRLVQVLLNLGSNAVKFNRDGGTIAFSVEERDPMVRIAVRDEGPGITDAARDRLFAPFERLGVDPAVEGTGLGLALSQRLMEVMDGTIGVDSTPGQGSTFWVELPVADDVVPDTGRSEGGPSTTTILYVDDNPESIAVVERLLSRRSRTRVLTALQGTIGLELAAAHDVDLVFVDVHLPDIAGDVVLARLRADPRTARIPVVMVSADVTPGLARRLRDAGAVAVLAKPLVLDEVLRTVAHHVGSGEPDDGQGR